MVLPHRDQNPHPGGAIHGATRRRGKEEARRERTPSRAASTEERERERGGREREALAWTESERGGGEEVRRRRALRRRVCFAAPSLAVKPRRVFVCGATAVRVSSASNGRPPPPLLLAAQERKERFRPGPAQLIFRRRILVYWAPYK